MIKKYFIPGLLVWLPIIGTFFIIRFVVNLLDESIKFLPRRYQPEHLLGFHLPGLGVILTLAIVLLTGFIATRYFGKRLVDFWDKLMARIPLVRGIHSAVKQVSHAILQPHNESFSKVLLIEWPRRDVWCIAFQTNTCFKGAPIEDDMVTVFLPTTPNPTSGFLTIIPKRDIVELDLSIDKALKMIISLGVVSPDDGAEASSVNGVTINNPKSSEAGNPPKT